MPVFETTVQTVTQRIVNKKAGGTATVYEIVDGDSIKWETFRQPLANEANRLIGQQVEIQGRVVVNGTYENHVIDDIRPGTGAQYRAQAGSPIQEQPQRAQERAVEPAPIPRTDDQGPTEKDFRIARQTAAKVSAQLSDNAKDFWANLNSLVTYFAYGLVPPEYDSSNALRVPAAPPEIPMANQFVPEHAYGDPGPDFSKPEYDDSSIPF